MHPAVRTTVAAVAFALSAGALADVPPSAQANAAVVAQAKANKQPLLDTLRQLVEIESGSGDREGLDRISQLAYDKLKALGGDVQFIEPGDDAYRMEDTPKKIGRMVKAEWHGTGQAKILMIAHMDTVYKRGMLARQPFRIEGDKALGLGIADDKQGVALVIHTVAALQAMNFKDYGTLTVLFNGDEEISSPGARNTITKEGAAHDLTMSFEGSRVNADKLSLATSGIGGVIIKVKGKASHAGSAPERGINALVELSNQILQTKDLSDPKTGLKMNWTMSQAGNGSHNVIPEHAEAFADVRVSTVDDYDRIEKEVRQKITHKIVPNADVQFVFERRRPPLQTWEASQKVADHAKQIYREVGRDLIVDAKAEGGGTDAAFAALKTKNAVIERFGLQGFGAHSTDDEYILVSSIEPRLYLATRLIMDVSQGKAL
jgi:glutamate carboxypeptidase